MFAQHFGHVDGRVARLRPPPQSGKIARYAIAEQTPLGRGIGPRHMRHAVHHPPPQQFARDPACHAARTAPRSEEHTSELQSLMRISYAVFCLQNKKHSTTTTRQKTQQPSDTTTNSTYIY